MVLVNDMDLKDEEKKLLAQALQGVTIPKAAAILNLSYTGAQQRMLVWEAKGWLKGRKTQSGKKLYFTNKEEVQFYD